MPVSAAAAAAVTVPHLNKLGPDRRHAASRPAGLSVELPAQWLSSDVVDAYDKKQSDVNKALENFSCVH